MAYRLARILFVIVRDRKAYDQTELEKMQHQQDERKKRRLKKAAERMGFKLVSAQEVPSFVSGKPSLAFLSLLSAISSGI